MAIVDSLSSPSSGSTFSANADFHHILTWTVDDPENIYLYPRYGDFNDTVFVYCRSDGTNSLILGYKDGTSHDVQEVTGVFAANQEYQVDVYGDGTNIKIDVDGVEKINETVSHNSTQTGGRIDHDLTVNDIELESWPYGEPVNLWPNADLESGVSEWTPGIGAAVSQSATQAWEQTYSLKCDTGVNVWAGVTSDVLYDGVSGSTNYTASYYFYVEDSCDIRVEVRDQDNNVIGGTTFSAVTADTWVRHHKHFTTGSDDTGIKLVIYKYNDATDTNFYVDAVMLETPQGSPSAWVNYASFDPDLVPADLAHAHTLDACDVELTSLALSVNDLSYAHTTEAPAVTRILPLAIDDMGHAGAIAGGSGGGWEVGAYIYPEGSLDITVIKLLAPTDLAHAHTLDACDVLLNDINLVIAELSYAHTLDAPGVTNIAQLVPADLTHPHTLDACDVSVTTVGPLDIADLSHRYRLEAPGVEMIGDLAVSELLHAHSIGACDVEFVVAISVTVDANGKPILKESGVERIVGINGDVGAGSDIFVKCSGTTVSMIIDGVQIGAPYESLALEDGTEFKVVSLGTAGAIGSVDIWPENIKRYLPDDLK